MADTENETNARQHIRIAVAELIEDREHEHSREEIAAFLDSELDHAFGEVA
ncbi:hypothetical protein [Streptomyces formicae]|uniref:Uncharacterized protein n=1 Tax=Streptomyces formicae TaxID=1616117 RepID=A0ABY3WJJ6_9ACTN|nr:hypothetical protein [Streptomyces formicae]UNM12310.1 hypothetical protein J4032_12895 [Streptomyces formicae]